MKFPIKTKFIFAWKNLNYKKLIFRIALKRAKIFHLNITFQ